MKHLFDKIGDLPQWLEENGQPKFRAAQIHRWATVNRADRFEEMTNLPKPLREKLADEFQLWTTEVVRHQKSPDGTEKLLLQLADGGQIECVLLRDGDRRSICVSSQVGCAMGCVFCASGLDGVLRNLTGGEIIEQMMRLQRLLPEEERLSHIVMMGMGEPLANLKNVLQALGEATSPDSLGISPRRITISTVGIPEAIVKLAELDSRYNLAISLHAPNDELRTEIVPTNKNIGIDRLLAAADQYFETSGRKLTFEYVMLAGINDQPQHARQLARLLANKTAILNVIPYNKVDGLEYETPSSTAITRFKAILEKEGIVIMFRQRKGDSINAACGQLRRSTAQKATPLVDINKPTVR